LIRKYRHKHDIPALEGYVTANIIEMSEGWLVEYLKVPQEWAK
jgi:hypothetical protein